MLDVVRFADLKKVAEFAGRVGLEKAIVAETFKGEKEIKQLKEGAKSLPLQFEFCHVLKRLDANELRKFTKSADHVAVSGGPLKENAFAAKTAGIFFLFLDVFGRIELDVQLAKGLADKKVVPAVFFSDLLNASPLKRASLFGKALKAKKISKKGKAEFTIFSGARNEWEMRSPRDLKAVAEVL